MLSHLERRFLFVTGKGGVGKSTVSAALALALAQRGKRVLVASCCTKERLSTLLGAPPLTPEIRPVGERIWGLKLEAVPALREYGGMMLRSRTVFNAVFDSPVVRSFLAGVPGLYEWAVLGKAWFHSTELASDGSPRFDVVIHDGPATGHALEMLRVPRVITEVAPAGILRRDADRALADLVDPRRSGVVVVTLPEELPTTEALELHHALTQELGLPVAEIVANAVLDPLFTPEERQRLLALPAVLPDHPGAPGLAVAQRRAIREDLQSANLERLAHLPVRRLPRLLEDATTPAAARTLAALLSA